MNNKFMKVVGLASVMTALVNCGSDGDSSGGGESIKSKFPPLTSSNTIEGTWILQSTGSYTYDYKNIGDNYAYTDYREGDFSTKSMIIIKQENETQISITSCEIIESFAFTDMLPEQPSSNEENSEIPETGELVSRTFTLSEGKYTNIAMDMYDDSPGTTTLSFSNDLINLSGTSSSSSELENLNEEITGYKFSESTDFTTQDIGNMTLSKLYKYGDAIVDGEATNTTAHCFDYYTETYSSKDIQNNPSYSSEIEGTTNRQIVSVYGTKDSGEKLEFVAEESEDNYTYKEDGESNQYTHEYDSIYVTLINPQGEQYTNYTYNESDTRYPDNSGIYLNVDYTLSENELSGEFNSIEQDMYNDVQGSASVKF